MNALSVTADAALTVLLLVFILRPLLTARREVPLPEHAEISMRLLAQKERLLEALQELEFDRSAKKVSSHDYQKIRDELEDAAVNILAQLEQVMMGDPEREILGRIHQEVAAARQRRAAAMSGKVCARCGVPGRSTDQFCPRCGVHHES